MRAFFDFPYRLLPLCCVAVIGCSESSSTQPETTADADAVSHKESNDPGAVLVQRPAFESWPTPQLTLIVTGEMHGYFEPCGCTANQLGGMARRADLVSRLVGKNWIVRGIDVGSLARRTGRQAQIKFDTTLAALRELHYSAVALGPEELRLGPEHLIFQHVLEGDNPLRFVNANLVFYGARDIGTPVPFAIVDEGGIKVGITSVMGDSVRKTVIPDRTPEEAASADIAWVPAVTVLPDVLQAFEDEAVDVRILLSQSSLDESREFARTFPSFDFVISAQGFGEGETKPEMIGDVRMLQVGEKGKTAGVIGLYSDDADDPVRFELVSLTGESFSNDSRMITHMQAYQDRLKDERIVTAEDPVPHPSGAAFVGADKCGECHTAAFDVWKDTPHADALKSLDPSHHRTGFERLNGVNRSFDPECLSCHVTGWDPREYLRFVGGFVNEEFATTDDEKQLHSLFAGNQCENCHGPGSRHIELIEADNIELAKQQVQVTLEQARDQMCAKCHDIDNSPEFDFDAYWKKVEHHGMD
jgi:Cytochrome c554 and c-prime